MENALADGENVDVADGALRTRPGTSLMSSGSLPAGEVMALANVRFPTNEVSYLVAQVDYQKEPVDFEAGTLAPEEIQACGMVWDVGNGAALLFDGSLLTYLYRYDPTADSWTLLAEPTGEPPHYRYLPTMIYAPASESVVMFGGYYFSAGNHYLNDCWVYDCTANTWTEQATTGDVPAAGVYLGVYRSATNSLIVCQNAVTCYELDLDTWVWTAHTTTHTDEGWFPEDTNNSAAIAYDSDNDTIIIAGGTTSGEVIIKTTWILNFDTLIWSRKADILTVEDGISGYQGFYCSGKFYIIGSRDGAFFPLDVYVYTVATNTWLQLSSLGTAPATGCITDVGTILLLIEDEIYQTEVYCTSAAALAGCALYACPDHLPTSTGAFTQIYDLGQNAGVCTFATLNDRVVITEGIAKPPLVWPGAMSDDASDWPHPKAVLIAQDGVRMYDVSQYVCDKDPDTVAQVGGIRTWGAIYICTDMPEVDGFYFDMESPNTGASGTTANTFHAPVQITEATDVDRQDLKATIANWVQSSGAMGHFTTSGGTTVTLGPGNVNPDIVPGILVEFTDGQFLITAITGDGSGAASVTLSDVHANAAVTAAYGLSVDYNGLTVVSKTDALATTWSVSFAYNTLLMLAGYSIRQVIPAANISTSGDHIRITLRSTYLANPEFAAGFATNHVSIVERSGATENGTTTPTEITFNNGESGCAVVGHYTEVTSDLIPFAIDETKDYLVIMDIAWATWQYTVDGVTTTARAGFVGSGGIGTEKAYVKEAGFGNEEVSWNLQTVAGFAQAYTSPVIAVEKIEVGTLQAVPRNAYVATTTDTAQLQTTVYEAFDSIAVDQHTPGSSLIYHAVSLDRRLSFWVFLAAAWRQIVKLNGATWQYNTSSASTPSWPNATVNSPMGALRQAFANSHNQMDKAALEGISSSEWATFFIPHITTTLDFACAMLADGSNVPTLRSYVVAYESGGQAIIEGFRNGAWTGGDGWTDNTIFNGSRLGQSGAITYNGTRPFKADYHVVDQVPGFWFRLLTNGTSPDCAIPRIRYKAPCQPLANIGDGQPDIALGVILYTAATTQIRDWTVELSDNVLTELSKADVPMQFEDYLYVGYLTPFNEIEITPYTDNNQATSVLSGEYWNGETWAALTIADGTVGSGGNTLAQKGGLSWTIPTDWRTSIPFDASFSRGYWVRFHVSIALTSTCAISELRVYGVPDAHKKYKFVGEFGNRIALGNRPDAPDQVDISRPFEEYGFAGQDSGSFRLGGTDQIACALSAWNGLLIGKTQSFHFLEEGAQDFKTVEAARHVPINSQVVVKAPISGFDYGERYGLFFLNRYGAFVSTGLHTDSIFNTSRGKTISDVLNWWDTTQYPRLDLDYLHLACGEYWPAKNWIVWSVPMVCSGSGPQASNNRLIVYDLTLGAWLPPFTIAAASLCTAYHYNANAPGKLGELGLYAGDYQGRVIRLFGPGVTSDLGSTISAWVETGWLDFGSPEYRKLLRMLSLYGKTAGHAITVSAYGDGDSSDATVAEFHDLSNLGSKTFALEQESHNVQGRFFKFRIAFSDASEVFGLQMASSLIRDWGAL